MNKLSDIITKVNEFAIKHNMECEINVFKGEELWAEGENPDRDANWAKFEKKAGVYCLIDDKEDDIIYIGESSTNVGNRLNNWILQPKTDKEIEIYNNLKNGDLIITVSLDKNAYLAKSLESFLISAFETKFNLTNH